MLAADYLNAVAEDGDARVYLVALRTRCGSETHSHTSPGPPAARFALALGKTQASHEGNQATACRIAFAGAHVAGGDTEAGGSEVGLLALQAASISFRAVEVCVVDGSRHLENLLTYKLPACLPQSRTSSHGGRLASHRLMLPDGFCHAEPRTPYAFEAVNTVLEKPFYEVHVVSVRGAASQVHSA